MYINLKMFGKSTRIILTVIISLVTFCTTAYPEIIKKIEISGNDRISDQTIIMFSTVNEGDDINQKKVNQILKDLYETNFFDNVSVKIENNLLTISVVELPIVNNINVVGVKAKKYKDEILKNLILKSRQSYNEFLLTKEVNSIKLFLKNFGFYFANVEPQVKEVDNNMVDINYKIDLGEKARIKKITFLGDKIYKDRKLRAIIVSEEYKIWKFISGKKFLNEDLINIDKRLLKNFYLNSGYYNVQINSSFAKLVNKNEFELIYNIDPKEKVFFNDLKINFPEDFNKSNFENLSKKLENLKDKPYSINAVEEILEEIDIITTREEFKTVIAELDEEIIENKLNINFTIDEGDKFIVEKINIFGNNITNENVIRNQLEIDEGDPFNLILAKKSENNIKSLNFFKNVEAKVEDGTKQNSKVINIRVQEKPTGEISAGAGVGTAGGTVAAGVKENNYLGRGLAVEASATITSDTLKGIFAVSNPNYKNTDKSIFFNIQATEIDRLKENGYKTNKTGFAIGTDFELLNDLEFGISNSNYYEKIDANDSASARRKSQEGSYWDTFVKLNFFYDKRNQKFKTTDGFFSNYSIDLPLLSDNNTLTNSYDYKIYKELYENNISSFGFFLKTANSISGDDIKLSERLTIPSRKLRGFERNKVGPKEGSDFIGGNYVTSVNLATTLPQLFPNLQNLDTSIFLDAANVWGVDYDSSIDDGNKLRSSVGIAVDWYTMIGPLSFSLTEVLTKKETDIEESFRFNIGTTF